LISWIESQKWQASALFSVFSLMLFGGLDLFLSGTSSVLISIVLALSVLFAVTLPWLGLSLVTVATVSSLVLDYRPGANGAIVLLFLLLIAAFASKLVRRLALGLVGVLTVIGVFNTVFVSTHHLRDFGLFSLSAGARTILFALGLSMSLSLVVLAWIAGRLVATRSRHVGTDFDRAVAKRAQARLALEVAEQNERFEIARDISELVIQRISATISIAEGGVYAVRSDPASASRILQQANESARSAHAELRRLFDMLNKLNQVSAAPPKLDDLEPLVIAYRELGFNINLRHEGTRFQLSEGSELAIYRIAFDALENVRKHAPLGTDVTIDFSWTTDGMQLLVKDNGIEISNRGLALQQLAYTAEEDRKALTETIRGAGITAMSERAALYEGSVEATRVPGVGFTVSAIFPKLRDLSFE
jgi:signal transduction histidine kinase